MLKALIPAKGLSRRVPDKNMRPFAGSSLLAVKIEALQAVPEIDAIVVNSDSDEILALAKRLGCETVKSRPHHEMDTSEYYRETARSFPGDVVIHAMVTSPLIRPETISGMIHEWAMVEKLGYDSLNSARLVKEFLWSGSEPLNFTRAKQERSQDLPEVLSVAFGMNILRRQTMIDCGNVIGPKPRFYTLTDEEALDIDTPLDFEIAEVLYRRRYAAVSA